MSFSNFGRNYRNSNGASGGSGTTTINNTITSDEKIEATTAQALVAGSAVILQAGDIIDYADNTLTEANSLSIGVITQLYASGVVAEVFTGGIQTCPAWSFTTGQTVYLGAGGVLTHTQPTSGQYITVLGIATAPNELKIDIKYLGIQL
ncbi:hypothetical protein [Francisella marina]|uniref:DUF2190 family protein n=1 Tax=Francisella marina TaxID=2249302 RepID=A0ABX5ZJI3_9GAMM|nr:hypothetical protein [Francisella marina]QEO57544.1 hypothetical protein F0R74_06650 [Francisella marina]